jgi:hypothetical protein
VSQQAIAQQEKFEYGEDEEFDGEDEEQDRGLGHGPEAIAA